VVNLADYQEIRIRQFHQTLDKYLDRKACAAMIFVAGTMTLEPECIGDFERE
jgi:hypothetical protein